MQTIEERLAALEAWKAEITEQAESAARARSHMSARFILAGWREADWVEAEMRSGYTDRRALIAHRGAEFREIRREVFAMTVEELLPAYREASALRRKTA